MVLLASGIATLLGLVGPHEGRPTKAPLDGGLVHDHSVLHIPPVVGHHGHDEVLSRGPPVEVEILHGLRLDQGNLGVVEQMAPRVGSNPMVGGG